MLADASFGTGEFLLWLVWIFLFVIWFWLIIAVFSDLFRRHDVGGWAKAFWIIFVIVFPFLGLFIYVITQGHGMAERNQKAAEAEVQALRQTVGYSAADEIAKLDALRAQGKLSEDEYTAMRAKVIGA